MQKHDLHKSSIILGLIFSMLLGCNRFTTNRTHDYSKSIDIKSLGSKAIATVVDADGRETAAFSAASAFTQEISASAASALSGTVLSFPPGSLVIDTAISLEEGSPLATASSAVALGIGSSVSGAGAAVVVNSSAAVDPAQPFVLKINLGGSSLAFADANANLIVIYKIQIFAENRFVLGVLPRSALTIEGQQVSFSTPHFGVFQTAYAEQPVTEATKVIVTDGVQTKREVAALPPLSITGRSLFVVGANQEVVLSGKNFRPTIKLAMGGKAVGNIRVLSDSSVSFTTPIGGALGLAQLTADQDGISQTISLIYSGSDSDIPVSTLGPADMCAGTQYYNGKGQLTTGTKLCSASVPTCTADGQVDCVVIGPNYAALLKSGAENKILLGQTLGGVTGNVILPAAGKVLSGTSYGGSGTGLTGALTLPTAGNVLAGSGTFGDSSALITPTLTLPAAGKVLTSTVYGVAGTGSTGTLSLPAPGAVLSTVGPYGDPGSAVAGTIGNCAANTSGCYLPAYVSSGQPLKAISYDAIFDGRASIRASLTLAGIAGTLVDCSGNGTTGCVTTPSFKSADLTNLAAGNIKRGISLAGITGNFPSATSPIPRYTNDGASTVDSGTDISDLTSFISQLTNDGAFEYWDSTGIRRTGSGDSDITAANVKNAVVLENFSFITGSYTGAAADCTGDGQIGCTTTPMFKSVNTSALTTWDIRAGKSAGGINGSIAFYKNMANTAFFDRQGVAGSVVGLDIYDTIDDYNGGGGIPTQIITGGDGPPSANWSPFGGGGLVYKENNTGRLWLRDAGTALTWENAISSCEGASAEGRADWRLPTQKELMQAYANGIWSQKINLGLAASAYYWSASTHSNNTSAAWTTDLGSGYTAANSKTSTSTVVCVAP